jgi:hypothetical protein
MAKAETSLARTPEPDRQQVETETDLAVKLAAAGRDREGCARLYARLDAEGRAEDFVEALTDTETPLLAALYDNAALAEAFRRRMQSLREELGWGTATPLERLLISRVALNWHSLVLAERRAASAVQKRTGMEVTAYLDRACHRAERRYLQAIHALSMLRRLQLPVVQFNVVERQLNLLQTQAARLEQSFESVVEAAPGFPSGRESDAERDV